MLVRQRSPLTSACTRSSRERSEGLGGLVNTATISWTEVASVASLSGEGILVYDTGHVQHRRMESFGHIQSPLKFECREPQGDEHRP